MARKILLGVETGDLSEFTLTCTGQSADSSVVNSAGTKGGAYSSKFSSNANLYATITAAGWTGSSRTRFKHYFRYANSTTPTVTVDYLQLFYSTSVVLQGGLFMIQATDGNFYLQAMNSSGAAVGSLTLVSMVANTWYRIDIDFRPGAGTGAVDIYLDGVNKISLTSQQFGTGNTNRWLIGAISQAAGDGDRSNYWDDMEVDDAALCNEGYVVARQFEAGTPTYDAWTKSSGTIDTVWSDTPFSASSNASSTVLNDAQTAMVALLSSPSTGHGPNSIGMGDTINGAKCAVIAKASAGSSMSIRARFSAADTDTSVTLTTSDAYYETAPFTDSVTDLSNGEVGAVQGSNTTTQTVEDAWLIVSYTPSANNPGAQAIF